MTERGAAGPEAARFMLPDVNVLVALTNPSHQHHRQAHAWLSETTRFATTPVTEAGLVRLLLNRAVVGQDVAPALALDILARIRADERAMFLPDDSSLAAARIDLAGLAGYRQVTDLHLVNLVAGHGGMLATFDRHLSACLLSADRDFVRLLG